MPQRKSPPDIHLLEQRIALTGATEWVAQLGGTADDTAHAVVVDDRGSLLVTGATYSADFVGVANPDDHTGPWDHFSFVAKLNSTGETLWIRYVYGRAYTEAIAVDRQGDIWIAGRASSAGGFLRDRLNDPPGVPHVGDDAFVAKLDSSGVILWATYLGGSGFNDRATEIAVRPDGRVFICGYTDSSDFVGSGNSINGRSDAFVAEISNSGELLWAKYVGGSGTETAAALSYRKDGSLVIAGTTSSADLPLSTNQFHQGPEDAYVAELTDAGEMRQTTYIGGAGEDYAYAMALEPNGDVLVGGSTSSSAFDSSGEAAEHQNAFVARLDSGGSIRWATQLGGAQYDTAFSIALDSTGSVYVAGHSDSELFPSSVNQARSGDGFVAELTPEGQVLWSAFVGGSSWEYLFDIAVLPEGRLLVVGSSDSFDFGDASGGQAAAGRMDAVVVAINVGDMRAHPALGTGTLGDDEIRVSPAMVLVNGQRVLGVQLTINGIADTAYVPDGSLRIHGLSGNDLIIVDPGVAFPLVIHGGSGNDTITGGSGDDLLYGDDGNDVIVGGGGNDSIYGNFGFDTLSGGVGCDQLFAGLGPDLLNGGDGDDTLIGGNGMDQIRGGAGGDNLDGKGKADTLSGGVGNDTITSGAGSDLIAGQEGDDTLYANPNPLFRDTLIGGAGHDLYNAAPDDVLQEVEEALLT